MNFIFIHHVTKNRNNKNQFFDGKYFWIKKTCVFYYYIDRGHNFDAVSFSKYMINNDY